MTAAVFSDTDLLAPLAKLTAISQAHPAQYYIRLVEDADPLLRVSAWRALFDQRRVAESMHSRLIADCRFGAVRSRAFDYFESIFEHDLARQAAETAVDNPEDAQRQFMRGWLDCDAAAQMAAEERRFLSSGNVAHIVAETTHAEQAGGWRLGVATAVRGFLAFPQSVPLLTVMFRMIDGASQAALMRELSERLGAAGVFAHLSEMAGAIADQLEGNSSASLSRLERLTNNRAVISAIAPFIGDLKRARADALHALGQFDAAYAAFVDLNAHDKSVAAKGIDPSEYQKGLVARGALSIPLLPRDPRTDTVFMVGFPRSGTTLLENALSAHPEIETFEEIPSQRAAIVYLERALGQSKNRAKDERTYLEARRRFYGEMDRRRRRSGARVLIDKLPIRSGDAKFLIKLFPERRYIFSIRHPHDIVFSCFRQRFTPNPAMENFRSILDAAKLYDFVMRQWFDVHGLDDPLVHYVRYDELVTDFENVAKAALNFLGLTWSDEMLSFAEKAAGRAAKTPSYQKVRQGLRIGVQSSWENYKFAFEGRPAELLDPWVKFLGYGTD